MVSRAWIVAVGAFLAALAAASAAPAQGSVRAQFLQGEQTLAVERPGTTPADALAALLAGPSPAEQRRRIATELPDGLPLLGLEIADGVARVDLGRAFQEGDPGVVSARVAQVVLTLTGFPSVREVLVLVDGEPARAIPGFAPGDPLRRVDVLGPPPAEPAPPPALRAARSLTLEAVQRRLARLGYLPPSGVDGRFGPQSLAAVIAFQKWEGLVRDGIPGPRTQAALLTARRPTPRTTGPGTRVEVLLDRQVALVIRRGRVLRTIHVSTGKRGYATPPGRYEVFRKKRRSWSVPYRVWLPWASYFVRGIAFHQARVVPVTPASHGCVRVTAADARWLYGLTPVGTKVRVIQRSLPPP